MTGIDVAALTEKLLQEFGSDLMLREDAKAVVGWLAARVEQDVRQRVERELLDEAQAVEKVRRGITAEPRRNGLSHVADTYRSAAVIVRGGSDAN